jgi:hypothetical protein
MEAASPCKVVRCNLGVSITPQLSVLCWPTGLHNTAIVVLGAEQRHAMQSCGLRDDGPCTRHNGVPPPQKHARLRLWGSSPPGSVAPCGLCVCLLPSLLYFVAGRL